MACGDVLSLEDLQTAKKHEIFEAEVITGKVGGLAGGADISTATNPVTGQVQKTLPAILDSIAWNYVGTFAQGVTFTTRTDFAVDADGTQWGYTGSFPFSATAGTVPSPPQYQVVHVRDHNALNERNAVEAHDAIYSRNIANIKLLGDYIGDLSQTLSFYVIGYYSGTTIGGGVFSWDASIPKSSHDGGMIVDPLALAAWDGTVATLPAMLSTSNPGNGCFVRKAAVEGVLQIVDFGAVTYDESAELSNHAALKAAQRHALTYAHPTTGGGRIFGTKEIRFPAGEMYFKGHRPFNYTRTELEAMGAGRYHSGMKFSGAGRNATVLLFKNTGSETWLYDNRDPKFPNITDTGIYDNLTFENLAIHNVEGKYIQGGGRTWSVPAASQMNGFWMQSFGWEKMFVFHSVNFFGFDRMYVFRGNGNVDQHTWTSCRFDEIIDCLFDVDNNQSVTNRLFGVDVLCRGSVLKIGPTGGGDFTWICGSIIQYFVTGTDGTCDNTIAANNPCGFLDVDLQSTSSGPSLARPNGNFSFSGLRFENYNAFNILVRARRTNSINYGEVKASFYDCTFRVDQFVPNGQTTGVPRTTHRELVDITRQNSSLMFTQCAFDKFQNFKVTDVGTGADISAAALLEFRSCKFAIDMPNNTYANGGGSIRSRMLQVTSTSKKCNRQVIVSDCRVNVSGDPGVYMIANDFSDTAKNCGVSVGAEYMADIKNDSVAWPSGGTSGNRIYLPEGARVIGFFIDKTAGAVPNAGSTSYAVKIAGPTGTTIYTSPFFTEANAFMKKEYFPAAYEVPGAPNNFVKLEGLNGSVSVDKGAGRAAVIYVS